jgi:hypothetical protein
MSKRRKPRPPLLILILRAPLLGPVGSLRLPEPGLKRLREESLLSLRSILLMRKFKRLRTSKLRGKRCLILLKTIKKLKWRI